MRQHLLDGMLDPNLVAPILKALRQPLGQPQIGVHLAQQQSSGIGGESTSGKISNDVARTQILKQERLSFTVCCRRSGEWRFIWLSDIKPSDAFAASLFNAIVIYPG